ncbi:MAG: hypothetical protein ACPGJV_14945, partial [Bacteriovoracaceae bacterium]
IGIKLILSDEVFIDGESRKRERVLEGLSYRVSRLSKDYEVQISQQRQGFILVGLSFENAIEHCSKFLIPGIKSASIFVRESHDLEKIKSVLNEWIQLKASQNKFSLKLTVKRKNKKFHLTSSEVFEHLMSSLRSNFSSQLEDGSEVDLAFKFDVLIDHSETLITVLTIDGLGGLPISTENGVAYHCLELNRKSLLQYHLTARAGIYQKILFFHPYPYFSDEVQWILENLLKVVSKFQKKTEVRLVPLGDVLEKIKLEMPKEFQYYLYENYAQGIIEAVYSKEEFDLKIPFYSNLNFKTFNLNQSEISIQSIDPLLFLTKDEIADLETRLFPAEDLLFFEDKMFSFKERTLRKEVHSKLQSHFNDLLKQFPIKEKLNHSKKYLMDYKGELCHQEITDSLQ